MLWTYCCSKYIFYFGVVLPIFCFYGGSVLTKRVTNVLGGSNVVNDWGVVGVMANLGPFCRRNFSTGERGLLDTL